MSVASQDAGSYLKKHVHVTDRQNQAAGSGLGARGDRPRWYRALGIVLICFGVLTTLHPAFFAAFEDWSQEQRWGALKGFLPAGLGLAAFGWFSFRQPGLGLQGLALVFWVLAMHLMLLVGDSSDWPFSALAVAAFWTLVFVGIISLVAGLVMTAAPPRAHVEGRTARRRQGLLAVNPQYGDRPRCVNASTLPATATVTHRKLGVAVGLVGLVGLLLFSGLGYLALTWLEAPREDWWEKLIPVAPFLPVPLFIVMLADATSLLIGRTTITLAEDAVTVRYEKPWGARQWTEPIPQYKGITMQHEYRQTFWRVKPKPFHTLLLYHEAPEKRIPIYESFEYEEVLGKGRRYCGLLGLPAISVWADGTIKQVELPAGDSEHERGNEGDKGGSGDISAVTPSGKS